MLFFLSIFKDIIKRKKDNEHGENIFLILEEKCSSKLEKEEKAGLLKRGVDICWQRKGESERKTERKKARSTREKWKRKREE